MTAMNTVLPKGQEDKALHPTQVKPKVSRKLLQNPL